MSPWVVYTLGVQQVVYTLGGTGGYVLGGIYASLPWWVYPTLLYVHHPVHPGYTHHPACHWAGYAADNR